MANPTTRTWEEALDTDGNPTVPLEEQVYLLPDDWDPSSDTNGGADLGDLFPEGSLPSDPGTEYGWNEKLNRWIDTPPGY